MRIDVEQVDDGEIAIVHHADGSRTLVAERDQMVATLTLSDRRIRGLRYSIANTEGARKRRGGLSPHDLARLSWGEVV